MSGPEQERPRSPARSGGRDDEDRRFPPDPGEAYDPEPVPPEDAFAEGGRLRRYVPEGERAEPPVDTGDDRERR